jgi:hypothetical protein
MRRCILSNKSKILLSSIIVLFAISSIFVALFNSQYLNIRVIEVSVDRGEVPPSVINYLKIYENENIFRINTNSLKQALENNPFIESAKIKITVSKKMTINLIKTKVNAIIKVIEKDAFALLSEEGLFLIEKEDLSIVDTQLIVIEMKQHLLNSLLINEYLGKFSILVGNLDLLNDSYYLISSVKYDNNVNNGFGFFKLELANTNTVIRVRQRVNTQLLEKAIDLAQEKRVNDQSITVLDVYHGAIIERSRPFGG